MKIEELRLSLLRNSEHTQFMIVQDVLAIRKGRKNQDDEADDTNDTKE